MRIRTFTKSNYRAIFINDKTIRFAIDPSKPVDSLEYPEFYDIAINNLCYGACPYCYIEATHKGKNYENVPEKIMQYFGSMTENQRPFQVAIGGAGEPTLHPELPLILSVFDSLGILPNYTTNGMHLTDEIIKATQLYSGGVAVTCHPHLEVHWRRAAARLAANGIRTNLHIIIGTKESVDNFFEIRREFENLIDYFVLLPYQAVGFAREIDTAFGYLFERLAELGDTTNIAFGALFHDALTIRPWLKMSLYEPHAFSRYLDMDKMILYPSSFDLTPVNDAHLAQGIERYSPKV